MPLIKYPRTIDLAQELTDGFAARFIRYKAGRLVGRAGFPPCDREDLEQDLRLHLVKRFPQFDPTRAHWNAFVVMVISRHVLTLVAQRRRGKRHHDLTVLSLDQLSADVSDFTEEPTAGRCAPRSALRDDTADRDTVLDVRHVMARLPPRQRELCRRLMKESPAEVARQMRVPRTTLSGRILSLRKEFTTQE
jgi:RNA polymerase sigma-70 factor, ECF subfamily